MQALKVGNYSCKVEQMSSVWIVYAIFEGQRWTELPAREYTTRRGAFRGAKKLLSKLDSAVVYKTD